MNVTAIRSDLRGVGFEHEALLYRDREEFLAGATGFLEGALEAGDPALVVVSAKKIELLRDALGVAGNRVHFADMAVVGSNPARIIPAWREFVDAHSSPYRTVWGIGEPISADRSAAELVECQRHESLLNLAFAETPGFRLLCPYDVGALNPAVIAEAGRSHSVLIDQGGPSSSTSFRSLETVAEPFAESLPEPPAEAEELELRAESLDAIRQTVARRAFALLDPARAGDLTLAANELATSGARNGDGRGGVTIWSDEMAVICEVRDGGAIADPLADRIRPGPLQHGGAVLWQCNQLCDLVQVRSYASGNVVRLHMRRA